MNAETFFESFDLLADAPNSVGKFRELILQLAVQGQLTLQDPSDEPADTLLERLNHERQKKSSDSGSRVPQPLPPVSPDEVPYKLPLGWSWTRLGCIGDTNIGLTYSPNDIGNDGIPVLRSSNIQNGRIDLSDLVRVSVDPKSTVLVEDGDLLICARNGSRAL